MANKVTAPNFDASGIYEGGDITQITAEELKGNIVAIRQLINTHNLATSEIKKKNIEIQDLKAENEYLKTSPFTAIFAAAINIIGSIIIGVATEEIGNEHQANESMSATSKTFLYSGSALVFLGSLLPVLYPYAKSWFNKKKNN